MGHNDDYHTSLTRIGARDCDDDAIESDTRSLFREGMPIKRVWVTNKIGVGFRVEPRDCERLGARLEKRLGLIKRGAIEFVEGQPIVGMDSVARVARARRVAVGASLAIGQLIGEAIMFRDVFRAIRVAAIVEAWVKVATGFEPN